MGVSPVGFGEEGEKPTMGTGGVGKELSKEDVELLERLQSRHQGI